MIVRVSNRSEMMAAFPDEQSCVNHLQAILWEDGEVCPYCGNRRIYHFSDRKTFKCGYCRRRFSIKVGTIFEGTKIPLQKWFLAIWLITNEAKDLASTTMAKELLVSEKTAWFIIRRLRDASTTKSFNVSIKKHGGVK